MLNVVIIPTYKEKENIEAMISAISSLPVKFDILIIDDNSPDGTADLVKAIQPSYPNLHLIERPGKMGLGTAYVAGFKWALENGYDYVYDHGHNHYTTMMTMTLSRRVQDCISCTLICTSAMFTHFLQYLW